jgi:(2Fe-2S) ferredoxin
MSQPELKIVANGTKCWYLNSKLHREDGPAVEYPDGTKHWFLNGEYHCEDGPAVEYPDGIKHWYLNGKVVTWQQVFRQAKNQEQQVRVLISALTTP